MKRIELITHRGWGVRLGLPFKAGLAAGVSLADLTAILPLILAQAAQILFHVIDNRYISVLGGESLYLHGIQLSFASIGIAIGGVSATSSLVFWRRKENENTRRSIFLKHLIFSVVVSSCFALVGFIFFNPLVAHYGFSDGFLSVARLYLALGLVNLVVHSVSASLAGMLVGAGKQIYCLVLAVVLLMGNWACDLYAIEVIYPQTDLTTALLFLGASTTALLLLQALLAYVWLRRSVKDKGVFRLRELWPVWSAEAGIGFVRCLSPFLMVFQLSGLVDGKSFISTYQLVLQLAYLFFVPLISGMQLGLRDAAAEVSYGDKSTFNRWWPPFFILALAPTLLLTMGGLFFGKNLLAFIYGYEAPSAQVVFISLFFVACMVGQVSDIFVIPLRARKENYLVTRNIVITEIFLLVGTRILVTHQASATEAGFQLLAYALLQLTLQGTSLRNSTRSEKAIALLHN